MEQVYVDTAKVLKALSDPKRLQIVDMLSCGELCACVILESFHITQPNFRREGKNIYYSLNKSMLLQINQTLGKMFEEKRDCICHLKNI